MLENRSPIPSTPRRRARRPLHGLLLAALLLVPAATEAGPAGRREKKEQKAEKILAENYVPGEAWEGYFRDDKGRTYPMIQPVEVHADKDWLGLTFTPYDGPKIRLGVMRVENKTAHVEDAYYYGHRAPEVPLGQIEELLTTSLWKTHRFELVERKKASTLLAEQDFGQSGRVSAETAPEVGVVQGADYLVFAAVNEWTPGRDKAGGGLGRLARGPLGAVKAGRTNAEVAMSFRVVDSTSGQVLFSATERAKAGSWNVGLAGFGGGTGGLLGYAKNAPINYAIISCINKGVYRLANWLKDRAWRGSVIKVAGDRVFINAGSDKGIEPGMVLSCLTTGDSLVDPETGLDLGAEIEAIGSLQVAAVEEKYAVAMILQGCNGLARGDRVELESQAL